jgi:2-C-methyl-D-erythritol 4-phosphate cytidylyltransferase
MGSQVPKQYLDINGKSVIAHTVDAFLNSPEISHTYVIVSAEDAYVDQFLSPRAGLSILRCGGASRAETVTNGLHYLLENKLVSDNDWTLVHDAARPGLSSLLIRRLIEQVCDTDIGGLLALPVVDTVKRVVEGRVQTIPRDGMWLAQTPQMFRARTLLAALRQAPTVTDEASAIEFMGGSPKLVEGHAHNRKLTLPDDIEYLQLVLQSR